MKRKQIKDQNRLCVTADLLFFDLVTFISLLFIFQTGAAAIRARARFNNRHNTCH